MSDQEFAGCSMSIEPGRYYWAVFRPIKHKGTPVLEGCAVCEDAAKQVLKDALADRNCELTDEVGTLGASYYAGLFYRKYVTIPEPPPEREPETPEPLGHVYRWRPKAKAWLEYPITEMTQTTVVATGRDGKTYRLNRRELMVEGSAVDPKSRRQFWTEDSRDSAAAEDYGRQRAINQRRRHAGRSSGRFTKVRAKAGGQSMHAVRTRFHDMLDVPTEATEEIIKARYKKLAFELHPDHGGDATHFRALTEARDELLKLVKA